MGTEQLTTQTKATYRLTRGEHGAQVAEEAQRLFFEHQRHTDAGSGVSTTPAGRPTPATFRAAAERIVTLEEAVRDRDKQIVDLHDEVTHWHQEADGHAADARYWENKYQVGS